MLYGTAREPFKGQEHYARDVVVITLLGGMGPAGHTVANSASLCSSIAATEKNEQQNMA